MAVEAKNARFSVGQLVHHRLFDYRGVVVDVDPRFNGTEQWYEQVARTRPPKDQPWYRVLVDRCDHETYVAQRNLEGEPDLVYPVSNIDPFSGPERGQAQGVARREGPALCKSHNAADGPFPGRPKGAPLSRHCGVALLVKGLAIHCGARLALPAQARSEWVNITDGVH